MVPAVSIGHSFIFVTLTSASGCVVGDMAIWPAVGAVRWMRVCVAVAGVCLSVDKSVSVDGDGDGDGGSGRVD
jgi:hypothetical protein